MPTPLLLLHGIPVTSTIWRPLIPALQRYGPVVAPDLLGVGTAPKPDIAYGPADYVRWIDEEVLAGVEGPVTLVAHDFGGAVGLAWAVSNPERVARLVILNTTATPESLAWGWVAKVPGFPALFAYLFRQRTIFRWMMRAWFRLKDDALIDQYAPVYAEPLTSRTLARIAGSWTFDGIAEIAAGLRRLTCPVQIIWGMEDRYIFPWKPNGERFMQAWPEARVEQIAGAAHFVQAERPAEVLAVLERFLS